MSAIPRPALTAAALIRAGLPVPASPWTRYMLTGAAWADLAARLLSDPLPLVTLWCDGDAVHALFLQGPDSPLLASVAVENSRYLALSPARPAIALCERIVRDLWGVEAMHARDLRPWLDHGRWGMTAPLSSRPGPAAWPPEPPEFGFDAADEAAGAFQLGLGPVQSLVIGPAHLRLTLDGTRIRRLEPLLGYGHRGLVGLIRGCTPEAAAPLAARIDACATVAHQNAFARAIEAATGHRARTGTEALRRAMNALECIAVDLHHLGRIARCAGLGRVLNETGDLREAVLAAVAAAFGHRLMLATIRPGGLVAEPDGHALAALPALLDRLDAALPALRVRLDTAAAWRRLSDPHAGAARARCGARLDGVGQMLGLARRLLPEVAGPVSAAPLPGAGQAPAEGIGVADSVHGPVWHWVRLQDGVVSALHVHDPVLPLWFDLDRAARDLPAEELALLCASFGLSTAGADL